MLGYAPVSLEPVGNLPLTELGGEALSGPQLLRGVPFDVPSRVIVLDDASCDVSIAVGRPAKYLIVAHQQLSSNVLAGGDLGTTVAEYVFHLVSGRAFAVPIRERFEIACVPTWWGGLPFLAFPDFDNSMSGSVGRNNPVSEPPTRPDSYQRLPKHWYLWVWENPTPDATVESIEIVPRGPRFAIGAVTTSDFDEYPFNRQARRGVIIELKGPKGPVEVAVDRGSVTNARSLVTGSAARFLADPLRGFGEPLSDQETASFAEIGALPSATVTISHGGERIAEVNWGELQDRGMIRTANTSVEIRDPGRNWVQVTVLDDETNRPVPCKVHFRSIDGIPYQPHGHHQHLDSSVGPWHAEVGADVRLGRVTYAYIDGTCEGWLPRGEVIVDVARGYEYEPLREKVRIRPGQRELTLRLRRWIDMNKHCWYSGDTHVHFLSQQGAHVQSQGEAVNVVNVLQSQWGARFSNIEEFTGKPSVACNGSNIVYVTQENRQHVLGHLTLLGLKRPVMPLCTDGPSEAEMGGGLDATMSDWADRCHEQGGLVIIPHLPSPNGEPATLIATGRADAVEMLVEGSYNHIEYYRYLNCGYRLPLVGGTDKMTSDVPVGMYRTYVHLNDPLTYENWCRGVALGRTFLSGGPIIHFSVDGATLGDTVQLSGAGTVDVEAWAESIFPIHTLQIVERGRVVASAEASNGARRLELRDRLHIDHDTWLAARCGGPSYTAIPHRDCWSRGIFAHTSPIYIGLGAEWSMFDESTVRYMLTLVDGCLSYIDRSAVRWGPSDVTYHHGEGDHAAWLHRPFLEARDALEERLAQLGLL